MTLLTHPRNLSFLIFKFPLPFCFTVSVRPMLICQSIIGIMPHKIGYAFHALPNSPARFTFRSYQPPENRFRSLTFQQFYNCVVPVISYLAPCRAAWSYPLHKGICKICEKERQKPLLRGPALRSQCSSVVC